jgi:anti-sigma regulatory factor (Ser/Thr protein kinase)
MPDPELLSGRIEFDAAPEAVRHARHWTAGLLAQSGSCDLVDAAVLLVSELVTNAIHASCTAADAGGFPDPGRIGLAIVRTGETVRIEVSDSACRSFPASARQAGDGEGGRGMQVIAALSKRWGLDAAAGRKVIWCELPADGQTPSALVPDAARSGDTRQPVADDFSLAGGEDPAELPRPARRPSRWH